VSSRESEVRRKAIIHPASGIRHLVSGIWYPASGPILFPGRFAPVVWVDGVEFFRWKNLMANVGFADDVIAAAFALPGDSE
jgi:hypothetical protein